MGLYDRVTFEEGIGVTFPDIGADPFERTWQTKSLARGHPALVEYKVTAEGRLLEEDAEHEEVPEEERPRYDEELGGFERPIDEWLGCMRKVRHGWTDTEYHGIFEFHTTIDGEYVSLEAKFTDGRLVEVSRNG
jgi:hypothetical protein